MRAEAAYFSPIIPRKEFKAFVVTDLISDADYGVYILFHYLSANFSIGMLTKCFLYIILIIHRVSLIS